METASAKTSVVLCLLLFLVSPALAADTSPSSELAIGQRIAEMLQLGFVRDATSTQRCQRIYESLHADVKNDPRVDYAHGVISLRQFKNKEAQADFLAAIKQPGPAYRPAWQAAIWLHFTAKEYDSGFDMLLSYAKLIRDPEQLPVEFRAAEVYWFGRVMSALELVIDSPQTRESWLQAEKKLTDILGADSIDNYNDGKEDVHVKHALIEDEIRNARERARERKTQIIEKKLDQDGKTLDAVKEKRESLKKSAANSKEDYEEQAASFKKQLQRAEKDLAFLERRGLTLMSLMLTFEQQVSQIQLANKNQNTNANTANAQRITALQNQLLIYQTEFQRTTALAQEVSMNVQRLTEQNAEFQDQHQKTTGELAQKDAAMEKLKERTLKRVADLKKAEANEKPPAAVEKLIAAKSFRSYIDLDLFAERDKILGSFGIKAEAKK